MYSFDSFVEETAEALKKPGYAELRFGQLYMNLLFSRRRDLYESISGTPADPFYDDQKITAFWRYLKDNW